MRPVRGRFVEGRRPPRLPVLSSERTVFLDRIRLRLLSIVAAAGGPRSGLPAFGFSLCLCLSFPLQAYAKEPPQSSEAVDSEVSPSSAETAVAASTAEIFQAGPGFYMGREIARTMHYSGAEWLVRESRDREEDCRTLLAELRLRPGMTVCDMGSGNGFYSVRMAPLLEPGGRVLAVEVQPEMLGLLKKRAKEAGIENIETILGTPLDPRLPEGAVDLVLLVDVYHEFSHPEPMLDAIRRSLKPAGLVALAEFRLEDPEVPIKTLHKMSKERILKEFPANGFELVREFDGLPWQHLMFFERAGGGDGRPAGSSAP